MLIADVTGHVSEPLKDVVEVELVAPVQENTQPAEPLPPEQPETPPEEPQTEEPAPPPTPPPPPPPSEAAETQADVPVLQPVEEFGEEDTGPQETAEESPPEQVDPLQETPEEETAEDPGTAEEPLETDVAETDAPETDAPETDAPETEEPATEDPAQEDPETEDPETEDPATEDPEQEVSETDVTETEESPEPVSGTEAETDVGVAEEETSTDFGIVGPIATDQAPKRKPALPARAARQQAPAAPASPPAGMLAARELYSRVLLDDPQARSAMRGMTESQRLNLLCMTELRAQITAVSALPPELLPRFRPPPGNVLQPRTAAFRSLGRWFDVSFRCEANGDVTRVENFAFKIGREIPQSQWLERGLTGF